MFGNKCKRLKGHGIIYANGVSKRTDYVVEFIKIVFSVKLALNFEKYVCTTNFPTISKSIFLATLFSLPFFCYWREKSLLKSF